jgi:hypothetical protein
LSMRASVKFNCKARLKTVKIDNVLSNWKLAPKLESRASVAQEVPCKFFGCRFLPAQFANSGSWYFHRGVTPHPSVS